MTYETLEFENRDGLRLVGRLERPQNGPAEAYVLFAHCFTCGKDVKAAFHMSRTLTQSGLAVLRFDFTGLGQSEGDFADTNFTSNVTDLIAAARFMDQKGQAPTVLIGHSFGGTAVIQAASSIPSVKALVIIGAPASPAHVKQHFSGFQSRIESEGQAVVPVGGKAIRIARQFFRDIDQVDMDAAVSKLDRPLLILHAPTDDVVGIEHAARIYRAAKHPKSFIALDGANHLLSDAADARYAGRLIAAWATRYIVAPTLPNT